jgi:MFS family permease
MAAAAVNISGLTFTHFWAGLVLLGVGWNFLFVGGTTLLTETYRSSERSKAQAANEFLVFGTVALTALSSGLVFSEGGWQWLNLGVLPALAAIFIATLWLQLRRSAAPA